MPTCSQCHVHILEWGSYTMLKISKPHLMQEIVRLVLINLSALRQRTVATLKFVYDIHSWIGTKNRA